MPGTAAELDRLRRGQYGQPSERRVRLLDQLELQFEAAAAEDGTAAENAMQATTAVQPFERRRPSRRPFPEHLPRERVVIEAPASCACCGSSRLVKMGEDITETLEVVPRQWKVVQTVRETFTCRACERISQPPAPFQPTPRGWAGPNLLAMVLFESVPLSAIGPRTMASGQHQPLNRQAGRYAREGVELSLFTLADLVGASALAPLHALIRSHVLAAERLHGDGTTVPVLVKGGARTGRLWTHVRDDRPFGGPAPPAAIFHFSPDRRREHPRHLRGALSRCAQMASSWRRVRPLGSVARGSQRRMRPRVVLHGSFLPG